MKGVSSGLLSLIAVPVSSSLLLSQETVLQLAATNTVFFIEAPTHFQDVSKAKQHKIEKVHDDDNNNKDSGLVGKLLRNKLPTITYPKEGKSSPSVAEVRRTLWDRSLETAVGSWKTELEQIVYLPINKNAHTRMVIALDDLADKEGVLHNATKQYILQKVQPPNTANTTIREVLDSHERLQHTTSRIFTILRDPIDRYISGTCQELIMRPRWPQCGSLERDPLDWIGCIIQESVGNGRFAHHQTRQVDHLATVLLDHPTLPISVLSVGQATEFMIELGVHERDDKKVFRDRRSMSYVASSGKVLIEEQAAPRPMTDGKARIAQVCALKSKDLSQEHLDTLCKAYSADVELLGAADINVPLCGR